VAHGLPIVTAAAAGGAGWRVIEEMLAPLGAEVVLAPHLGAADAAVVARAAPGAHVVTVGATGLDAARDEIGRIAAAVEAPVERAWEAWDATLARVDAAVRGRGGVRVACIVDLAPALRCATSGLAAEVVARAGGVLVDAPRVEALADVAPDVVLVAARGVRVNAARRLAPVQLGPRAFLADGCGHFHRAGPRLARSVELATWALWPDGRGALVPPSREELASLS
jgi:hypothetical protein